MRIGAVTIGQSPRVDVLPEFRRALGMEAEIVERGGLDGLTPAEVRELAPREGDGILVTRMADGTEVRLAERSAVERIGHSVRALEVQGVDLIALFCTGQFPGVSAGVPLLVPDRLLNHLVAALLPAGVLGVVMPASGQLPIAARKWETSGLEVVGEAVSPYTASPGELEQAARRMEARGPDLIVLDCIGFTGEMRRVFRRVTGRPVLLPRTVLGRVAGALLEA